MPTPRRPHKPNNLDPQASELWDDIVPTLDRTQVLAVIDRAALIRLVNTWSLVIALEDDCKEHGHVERWTGIKGEQLSQIRPEARLLDQAERRLIVLLAQFGLTPAARSRVRGKEETDGDPAESYFKE